MKLILLEEALQKAIKDNKDATFSRLILSCRDAIGMKQYRGGEFIGAAQQTLARLEKGFYCDMPTDVLIERLHLLYGIDKKLLEEKAEQHVRELMKSRKVRVISEPEEV